MPHARTGWFAVVIGAIALSGCGHRLPATAAEPVELVSDSLDEGPSDPSLEVEVRPGGLVAHVVFVDDDGRRRVRVRDMGGGKIEIRVLSKRKRIAPWSKCARVYARRTIDLDVGGLAPGRYRVALVHNGVETEPRELEVTAASDAEVPTASLRSGERRC